MDAIPYIKEIGRGAKGAKDLSREHAQTLFGAMLDGQVSDLQLGAILIGMRIKGESDEEMQGFKRALDARTPQLALPAGKSVCALLPSYNGARRQPNLMPLVARLLQRAGMPVLIHGRHDFDTRVDPAALIAALGIPRAADTAQAGQLLATQGIAYLGLDSLCPGLDQLVGLRPKLGLRSSGHTLAKLIDPCRGHSLRLVAVTHPEYLDRMRSFLIADGGRALLMRGTEGEPYANPRRRPQLECFVDGRHEVVFETETGGAPPLAAWPDTPDTGPNARLIADILADRLPVPRPILEQVQCCLYAAGL